MYSQVVTYSTLKPVFTGFGRIQNENSANGINCQWKQYIKNLDEKDFWCEWVFDWRSLAMRGAERVEGTMTVILFDRFFINSETHEIDVKMEEPLTRILKVFDGNPGCSTMASAESAIFCYKFSVFYQAN